MIIKSRPEDFRVSERNALASSDGLPPGDRYGVYVLTKTALGTPDAVRLAARRLGVPAASVRYAGLKDRWAVTEQVVTIDSPRNCAAHWPEMSLRLVGRSGRHTGPKDIVANRFDITVRGLESDRAELARAAGARSSWAYVNYFDDQRFGSIREGGEFAGEALVRRQWQEALRRLIAAPGPLDLPREARLRRLLAGHWGDWDACIAALAAHGRGGSGAALRICRLLARNRRAFREAVNLVPRDVLVLHLAAYQSHMWNAAAREAVRLVYTGPVTRVAGLAGEYLQPQPPAADEPLDRGALGGLSLPTLGRGFAWSAEPGRTAIETVLGAADLGVPDFVIRGLARYQLRSSLRALVARPSGLEVSQLAADTERPGSAVLRLSFELPPGAYATMLLKSMFGCAPICPGGAAGGAEIERDDGSPPQGGLEAQADDQRQRGEPHDN